MPVRAHQPALNAKLDILLIIVEAAILPIIEMEPLVLHAKQLMVSNAMAAI